MRREQVREVVRRVRHMPGWQITYCEGCRDIQISASVPDSSNPRRILRGADRPTAWVVDAHTARTESALLGRIFDKCQDLMLHEAAEWFKYKGRRVFDPHEGG